ncbi:hypothetical protein BH11ARM2_BH11ARM2_01150 [soil metagenome]
MGHRDRIKVPTGHRTRSLAPDPLELAHGGVGELDAHFGGVADGEGDKGEMVPLVTGPSAPLDARRLAVLLVHLEPEADLMVFRHVRLEELDERAGNEGVELEKPSGREPMRQDQLHLLLDREHHIHLEPRLDLADEINDVDATDRAGDGIYEHARKRGASGGEAQLARGPKKIAPTQHPPDSTFAW